MPLKRLALVYFLLAFVRLSLAADWKPVSVNGHDYVSFTNLSEFYRFAGYTRVGQNLSLRDHTRRLSAQAGSNEISINGVRFLTDFPLVVQGDQVLISATDVSKIVDPILRPNKIETAKQIDTVVLDPGHGGVDSGTIGLLGKEKDYVLDVAQAARQQLLKAGFSVEMTRSADETVSLEDRVAQANRDPNAVFISIHFNSAASGEGVETYTLAPEGVASNDSTEDHPADADTRWYPGNGQDPANIALAAAVHGAILSRVSVFDRGVRHARFEVLREAKVPAVLVEAGFLNDPPEAAKIARPEYRKAISFDAAKPGIAAVSANLPPHSSSITAPLGSGVGRRSPPAPQPASAEIRPLN